jgi:alpha-beta hydrolase superfamily lysophospholipase
LSETTSAALPTLVHLAAGDRYCLWGDDRALELALAAPEVVDALILEAPAALNGQPVETLTVPTLVVYGTADQQVAPQTGRAYRERMPNCNYVLVYKAAHEVAVDRPEAFASLVSDFLERREAFIVNRASSLLHP